MSKSVSNSTNSLKNYLYKIKEHFMYKLNTLLSQSLILTNNYKFTNMIII